jgi:hypothetical protein
MSTLNHYQILQVQYLEKPYVNFKPVPDITGTVEKPYVNFKPVPYVNFKPVPDITGTVFRETLCQL